jgi:hypothetical protein
MYRMRGSNPERKELLFIPVFVLLLFVPNLLGQGYYDFRTEKERIVQNAPWKAGAFRIFPSFQLRNIGYDDNVYYQQETDEAVSDFTGTFSPEVTVHVLFRSFFILSVRENPQYVYFFHEERERRWNNTFSPEFRMLLFNRLGLGGGYSKSSRRWRPTSEFDVRANEYRESYKGSLFFETPRRTSIGIQIERERITYEDITLPDLPIRLGQTLNRDEKRIHGELYYRIFPVSFIFLKSGMTEYSFLHPASQWRDSRSYQLYAGIRMPQQGKLRGTFSLGYKKIIPESEQKQGFSGFVIDSQMEYGTGKMVLRFRASRDCVFSYWTNNIFFIHLLGSAGASFYVSDSIRLDYQLQHGISRYPEPFPLSVGGGWEEIIRKDTYRIHTIGFAVRVIREMGVGAQVVWWEWLSNLPGVDRTRLFVGGFVTYEF